MDSAGRLLSEEAKRQWDYYTITSSAERLLALTASRHASRHAHSTQSNSQSADLKSSLPDDGERKYETKTNYSDLSEDHLEELNQSSCSNPIEYAARFLASEAKQKWDYYIITSPAERLLALSAFSRVSKAKDSQSGHSGARVSGGVPQTISHPPQSGHNKVGTSDGVPQTTSHPPQSGHNGVGTSGGVPQTTSHPQSGHRKVDKTTSHPSQKYSTARTSGEAQSTSSQLKQGITWRSCALALFGVLAAVYLGGLKFWTLSGGPVTTKTSVLLSSDCLFIDLEDQRSITLQRLFLLHYGKADKKKELRIIKEIAGRWQELGLLLGLRTDQIAQNPLNLGPDYVENCCTQVLREWLEKGSDGGYQVSWKGFIKAIRDLQLYRTASEIENALNCVIN